ncbi:SpaH/EbpB family LPXTG-anchored major pilin [Coprococcus comes]|uniref:SpaH/EbpB family LPXTG-anchored major pilin n=1 Tax=Coprococcus comes TaxID=410072 RepID=UPI00156E4261|nr:SpaH/EbpB family LPXTG-anchored major pilin [Coprococcus comes]NSG31839.1 isopeptide-forming domain-containing fimbrial protein [Coprococcus comes]
MKKLVSRFMAVLMAMTMILSMSMTAFAAEASTGTLTVNNTVAGKTLDLYQIFTATKNGDKVAYTLNSAYEGFFKTKEVNGSPLSGLSGEALSEAAYNYVKEQVGDDGSKGATFAKDILGWILSASGETKTAVEATHRTANTADTKTVIDNLEYGYYVVYPLGATDTSTAPGNGPVKSVASLVSVTGNDATVNMKSNYPTVVKKVNDKIADDVNIGDTVTYTLTSKVPDMTGYTSYVFNFKDTLSAGLTFKEITSVTVESGENVQNVIAGTGDNTYTLTQDGQNITITMNNFLASNANKAGQEIKVTYTATLNKDAVTGFDANKNSATVEYSNKPGTDNKGESEPSIVDVHTFNFTIFKYYLKDQNNKDDKTGLENAEFELYKANSEVAGDKVNIKKVTDGEYRVATPEEAAEEGFKSDIIVSGTNGKVLVKGLDAGTYYLRETKAPEGYNKLLSDIEVKITATYTDGKLESYKVDYKYNGNTTTGSDIKNTTDSPEVAVENKTGAQLPSTGSKGALMVTLAGIVLFGALTASKAFGKKKANN